MSNEVKHWLLSKITGIIILLISVWLLYSLLRIDNTDSFKNFLSNPINGGIVVLYVYFSLHHSLLGIESILNDYMKSSLFKSFIFKFMYLVMFVLTAITGYSVYNLLGSSIL